MKNQNLPTIVSQLDILNRLSGDSLSVEAIAKIPMSAELVEHAYRVKKELYGNIISYSPKVFIPLTFLCRDVCHYCTFAKTPKKIDSPYLSSNKIMDLSISGETQGCKEALFTLGEKPELRYKAAREFLSNHNYGSTIDYLFKHAKDVFQDTDLIPHINAGNLSIEELIKFKDISGSVGLMLESSSYRLTEKGMPHYGSPDKLPSARMETLINAGVTKIPFTTGVLIGIGETREEYIQTRLNIFFPCFPNTN